MADGVDDDIGDFALGVGVGEPDGAAIPERPSEMPGPRKRTKLQHAYTMAKAREGKQRKQKEENLRRHNEFMNAVARGAGKPVRGVQKGKKLKRRSEQIVTEVAIRVGRRPGKLAHRGQNTLNPEEIAERAFANSLRACDVARQFGVVASTVAEDRMVVSLPAGDDSITFDNWQ